MIKKEINKYEIRCANCHTIKILEEFDWLKGIFEKKGHNCQRME